MNDLFPFLMDGIRGDDSLLGFLLILLACCGLAWCLYVWRLAVLECRQRQAQRAREVKADLRREWLTRRDLLGFNQEERG